MNAGEWKALQRWHAADAKRWADAEMAFTYASPIFPTSTESQAFHYQLANGHTSLPTDDVSVHSQLCRAG
jgi:hypothetical protein